MGQITSSMRDAMSESFKKQQEFMLATQKMQLERQIAMQHMMAKKQMSLQMARQRELFNWVAAFTGTTAVFALLGTWKSRRPTPLVPLLPLSFLTAYQYDMAYGDKIDRIRRDAEIILDEGEKTRFPYGDLTLAQVDSYRK